ncbi:MAG: hypothetical protein HYW88_02410 [Candidatus Sungbacteria bacterium]|nr:hypothetical protein [Candidatus Sungbacteria bacterium]
MVIQDWGQVIAMSLQDAWAGVVGFVPLLIGAVIVFIIGWIVSIAVGKLVEQVIRALKVDQLLAKLDFEKALERAGMRLNSGAFIGGLVKWFLIIVFMLAAVNILGERFQPISDFLVSVLQYLPNVIVSALILVIAALVADTVEGIVRGSVGALGMKVAPAAVLTRWAIWIFAVIAALLQLGVAAVLLQTVVTGVVAMAALAFGLAFGLGGKEAAADIISKMRRDISA